jgi:protein TonB
MIHEGQVQQIGGRRPQPASAQAAVKVGNGVSAPKLLFKTEPAYTEEARVAKVQGLVKLYIEVGTDGVAHNIQLKQGIGLGLDESAADAVSHWRFQPATLSGQPVNVAATVEINFRLL